MRIIFNDCVCSTHGNINQNSYLACTVLLCVMKTVFTEMRNDKLDYGTDLDTVKAVSITIHQQIRELSLEPMVSNQWVPL
jgi:hypothetical protein